MDEHSLSRIEQLLEETKEIAEENNELLRSIRRQARWSFWGKLILWLLVLVLPFLVIGHYLNALLPFNYGGGHSIFGLPSTDDVKTLLDTYKASQMGTSTP